MEGVRQCWVRLNLFGLLMGVVVLNATLCSILICEAWTGAQVAGSSWVGKIAAATLAAAMNGAAAVF